MSFTLQTSLGSLKVELLTEAAPRNCESFLALLASGFYTGTLFHRSIAGFMIQGGDPSGSGKELGESVWGGPLEGEASPALKHSSRGMVSMCASPGGNGSQFFITYAPAPHLDGESTVVGRVIGGEDTLKAMEAAEVGKKSRPLVDIRITGVVVHANPFST
jgi:peptidyl-prolyl cis-trans isomerase-like 3